MRIRKLKKNDFFLLNDLDWSPLPKERDSIFMIIAIDQADCSFIAEEDGKFLGVILSTRSADGKSIYINQLLVEKDVRKKGVGRKLLARVESYARKAGVKRIWLFCYADTIIYYKAKGYRESCAFLTREIKEYLRRVKKVHAFVKEF
ncbi:MAG TPA: GNAT family N-acetyltransferase [archaeon]|nr:GNAT family N-acetyltransferase [archaeon]